MISHRGPMAPGVGLGLQRPRPAGRGRGRRRRRAAGEALVDPGASGGCFSRQNVGISWENIGNNVKYMGKMWKRLRTLGFFDSKYIHS